MFAEITYQYTYTVEADQFKEVLPQGLTIEDVRRVGAQNDTLYLELKSGKQIEVQFELPDYMKFAQNVKVIDNGKTIEQTGIL